jgi:hypothetical protein
MNPTATVIGVSAVYVILMLWCLWKLTTTAKRVHTEIDALQHKAEDAFTQEELEDAEVSLRVYAAKDMPRHRAFTRRVKAIHTYLQGRKKNR